MTMLRASPVPLYLQIEERIRAQIRTGELQPFDQILSEIRLAEMFGVSRMTARKSLDRLVSQGLVIRRAGKGTFAAPAKIAHGASTRISFSAAMRDLGLTVTTRVLDSGLTPATRAVAIALGQPPGVSVAFMRRLRLVAGEPAAIHLAFLAPSLAGLLDQDLTGSLYDLMTAAGARVADARDTIEAVSATGAEAKLLRVRKGTALVRIAGVGFSASHVPLRYTEGLYRGDRFRFELGGQQEETDFRVQIRVADSAGL